MLLVWHDRVTSSVHCCPEKLLKIQIPGPQPSPTGQNSLDRGLRNSALTRFSSDSYKMNLILAGESQCFGLSWFW